MPRMLHSIKYDGPLFERLRKLCLSLPETREINSWGHPNFRAGKRTFVAFEEFEGQLSIAFRLTKAEIDRLLRREQFFITPYGRGQWVSVWADSRIGWKTVEQLAQRSYRLVALKRMLAVLNRKAD